jgi:hypothetical protein
MIQPYENICAFRHATPGISGKRLSVNDPILDPVKNDLKKIKEFLEKEFSNYRGFDFIIEESKGQTYFPYVLHVCILPPNQTVSKGIYAVICFDILGRGALVGCAESVTNPRGLKTVKRKIKNADLLVDVDGGSKTTKYNDVFENPKEFDAKLNSTDELLQHIRLSLDLALYHLGLFNAPELTIEARLNADDTDFDPNDLADARRKISRQIAARRGQRKFRTSLLEAYNYTCPISKCQVQSVLEAAHIMPYKGKQTNHIQNGLLLRSDIHLLFDLGLLTIMADTYQIKVHSSLKESSYFEWNGQKLDLPKNKKCYPHMDALRHHNLNEFKV